MKKNHSSKPILHESGLMQQRCPTSIEEIKVHPKYLLQKIITSVLLLFMLFGCFTVYSQGFPRYPIPSYNIPVTGFADFANQVSTNQQSFSLEKKQQCVPAGPRHIIIRISAVTDPGQSCQATVWVYSLDLTTVLGPYYLSCGDEISVPIDDRQWGVMVDSEDKVVVDVWYDDGSK